MHRHYWKLFRSRELEHRCLYVFCPVSSIDEPDWNGKTITTNVSSSAGESKLHLPLNVEVTAQAQIWTIENVSFSRLKYKRSGCSSVV